MDKRNLKKIFAAFMAAAALSATMLAACADGGNNGSDDSGNGNGTEQTPGGDNNDGNDGNEGNEGNTPAAKDFYWNKVASYYTGYSSADGGVAEIVQYNEDNGKLYLVNGLTRTVDIVTLGEYGEDELETTFDANTDRIDLSGMPAAHPESFEDGFEVGDITSVAVNTELDVIACAVQHTDYEKNGAIVILGYDGTFRAAYPAGVQPDMVTFAGNIALSANEGEPRMGYESGTDPLGSVTAVDLSASSPEARTITFESFDAKRDELVADKVLLKKDTAPSADLEPEYIAVSGNRAFVALQEANAVATLDLESMTFTSVKGLGFKDHSAAGNGLDLLENGKAEIAAQDVLGVYMPDGMATYEQGGKTYLVTANEGDAREWNGYENIEKYKVGDTKVEVLINSETDGLEEGKHYLLGARSFSVWDADDMSLVFDSGDMIESYIAASDDYKAYFNCNNDDVELDSRSKKKGPEPEAVNVQTIGGRTYAFVALERQGGALTFDITDLEAVEIVAYANSRDYSGDMLGDVAPESIDFIPAAISPNGKDLMVVANENSGTVAVYAMEDEEKTYKMHSVFVPAEQQNADHLLIWSVFGNGGKDDGSTTNDFITIHNPTDSAVALDGWKVRYAAAEDDGTLNWTEIALSGTLEAGCNYIIIGKDTGNTAALISFAAGDYDQKVDTLEIDNKHYSLQLTDGEGNVVDALGVTDEGEAEQGEGTLASGINKHSIIIRKDETDTDNNATDFEIIDFDDIENAADYKPVKR